MRTYEPLPPGGAYGCLCDCRVKPAELGECRIAGTPDGGLRIVHADPVVAVAGRLLWDWHDGTPPSISLECSGSASHLGDVIRIDAEDRRVVYRITGWRDAGGHDVYTARWPD